MAGQAQAAWPRGCGARDPVWVRVGGGFLVADCGLGVGGGLRLAACGLRVADGVVRVAGCRLRIAGCGLWVGGGLHCIALHEWLWRVYGRVVRQR